METEYVIKTLPTSPLKTPDLNKCTLTYATVTRTFEETKILNVSMRLMKHMFGRVLDSL